MCTNLRSSSRYLSSVVHSPSGLHSPECQAAETSLSPPIHAVTTVQFLANYFTVACIYICCQFRNLEVSVFEWMQSGK